METINATHTGYLKDGVIYEDYNWMAIGRSVERMDRFLKTANKVFPIGFDIAESGVVVKYIRTYQCLDEYTGKWVDCGKETYDKMSFNDRIICAKPVPEKPKNVAAYLLTPQDIKDLWDVAGEWAANELRKEGIDGYNPDTPGLDDYIRDVLNRKQPKYTVEHTVQFNVPDIYRDILVKPSKD